MVERSRNVREAGGGGGGEGGGGGREEIFCRDMFPHSSQIPNETEVYLPL